MVREKPFEKFGIPIPSNNTPAEYNALWITTENRNDVPCSIHKKFK